MILIAFLIVLTVIMLITAWSRRSKVKQHGVIQDFWDKYNTTVLSLGSIVLVTIFGFTTADQWNDLFGTLGEVVRAVDVVVVGLTVIYTTVKGWFDNR